MKKNNTSIYIIAVLLILFAFCIPYFVFLYEDRRTSNYDIHYTAENVTLEDESIAFYEKLNSVSENYSDGSFVYLNNSDIPGTLDSRMTPKEVYEKALKDFADVFVGNVPSSKLINSYSNLDYSISPVYMIRTFNRDMYLVWDMVVFYDDMGSTEFIIDDESGKLLSFRINVNKAFRDSFIKDIESKDLTGRMGSYYNLNLHNIKKTDNDYLTMYEMFFNEDSIENTFSFIDLKMIVVDSYDSYTIYYNFLDESYLVFDSSVDSLNDENIITKDTVTSDE